MIIHNQLTEACFDTADGIMLKEPGVVFFKDMEEEHLSVIWQGHDYTCDFLFEEIREAYTDGKDEFYFHVLTRLLVKPSNLVVILAEGKQCELDLEKLGTCACRIETFDLSPNDVKDKLNMQINDLPTNGN